MTRDSLLFVASFSFALNAANATCTPPAFEQQAVVLGNEGCVLVNVPSPERYALHKLLVYGERTAAFRAKSTKDLAQAACLAAYLWDHRREALADALKDLLSRGKGWVSRYKQGAAALHKAYPQIEVSARLATAA